MKNRVHKFEHKTGSRNGVNLLGKADSKLTAVTQWIPV